MARSEKCRVRVFIYCFRDKMLKYVILEETEVKARVNFGLLTSVSRLATSFLCSDLAPPWHPIRICVAIQPNAAWEIINLFGGSLVIVLALFCAYLRMSSQTDEQNSTQQAPVQQIENTSTSSGGNPQKTPIASLPTKQQIAQAMHKGSADRARIPVIPKPSEY